MFQIGDPRKHREATMGIEERHSPSERVRVLAADRHTLVRQAVAQTIRASDRLELVAEVPDGREALTAIHELEPDVALLDITLPGLDGPAILNAVQRDALATKVIFLAAELDARLVCDMVDAGAEGVISTAAEPDELRDAILAVVEGRPAFGREAQVGLASEITLRRRRSRPVLSERERQVIDLTGEGLTAPEIAERLVVSTTTIRTHLNHLYKKLGVSDRAAAVREAMRRGLLE